MLRIRNTTYHTGKYTMRLLCSPIKPVASKRQCVMRLNVKCHRRKDARRIDAKTLDEKGEGEMGAISPTLSADDHQNIFDLWKKGTRLDSIAKRYHIGTKRARQIIRARAGAASNVTLHHLWVSLWMDEYQNIIADMRKRGMKQREIAQQLNIPLQRVRIMCRREFTKNQRIGICDRCKLSKSEPGFHNSARSVPLYHLPKYNIWVCYLCKERIESLGASAVPKPRVCLWCKKPFMSPDAAIRKCAMCQSREEEPIVLREASLKCHFHVLK